MAYYDEAGNVVENLVPKEEVDKQLAEANTKFSEQITAEKTAAEARTKELEAQVAAAQAAVDKAGDDGDKSENLANMRKKVKETEDALKAEREANAARWNTLEGDRVASAITAVAGTNKELADKIKFHFDKTLSGVKAVSAEEIQEKVKSAFKLSADHAGAPSPLDAARGGNPRGAGQPKFAGQEVKYTPEQKAAGKVLGVTEEDYKKYATDPRITQ